MMTPLVSKFKPNAFFLFGPLCLLAFFSCRSYEDLLLFKDRNPNEAISVSPPIAFDYTIRQDDNLYVGIISNNAEMNKLYNPALAGNIGNVNNINYESEGGQFIHGYYVDKEGMVTLPIIGRLKVAGLSLKDCEDMIFEEAKKHLKIVTVKVRLLNYKVTVLGEVDKPGLYYNYAYYFTVLDALGRAGGITDFAEVSRVVVIRQKEKGNESYDLDLSSKKAIASEGYFLYPNDVVIVEPSKGKNIELKRPHYSLALTGLSAVVLLMSVLIRR